MKTLEWNIFFDLHEVLIDLKKIPKCYDNYLINLFSKYGYSEDKIKSIHKEAGNRWITQFKKLNSTFNKTNDPDSFMDKKNEIDEEWISILLKYIPKKERGRVRKSLVSEIVEYRAMKNNNISLLFPETLPVLKILKSHNFRLFIASSASSYHIQGFIDKYELQGLFDAIIGVNTVRAPKKAQSNDYFKRMLKFTGSTPNYSIFVGDSEEEALHAQNVDMEFIMVDRKNSYSKNDEYAFAIIKNLYEIIPIIAKITGIPLNL
ncbi:MAG: hypothetical protein BAJALOKI2v1_50070 [Promethearchaeota archaeon]|nr:MAG: hypothetical protein BAJALOKI2v1_50070 [Candidatus Lokiarchaeota archaeon]